MTRPTASDPAERIRNLIALDAANVMYRLESRKRDMIEHFSKRRDREALLGVIHSWFPSATFEELVLLDPHQQSAASEFYETLDELRFYFKYTEDMPGTAADVVRARLRQLAKAYEKMVVALGLPVPGKKKRKTRKKKGKK